MEEYLFNSFTDPIPPLRYDVQIIPLEQDGESYLYFHDEMGYATPNFALPFEAQPLLSLINGNRSVTDLMKFSSDGITKEQLLEYMQFLDRQALLDSVNFAKRAESIEWEYEQSEVHESSTAGISYPADPVELQSFLDKAFAQYEQLTNGKNTKALYAPHIDPRVGISTYVKAFSSIRHLRPKRVVILATSHYAGLYDERYAHAPFIITRKNFRMPNGTISSDTNKIEDIFNSFKDFSKPGISFSDRAYRLEHSVELHLLFLNYIWNHEFEIVPILVGSLDGLFYMENGFLGSQVATFTRFLAQSFSGKDTFFLISGDLSHVGKKFGDERPASKMFDEIKINDKLFLETGINANPQKMLALMQEGYDPYRICGFPPLFTFLNAFPGLKGTPLSYDIWDETERESAVSFGSILYE